MPRSLGRRGRTSTTEYQPSGRRARSPTYRSSGRRARATTHRPSRHRPRTTTHRSPGHRARTARHRSLRHGARPTPDTARHRALRSRALGGQPHGLGAPGVRRLTVGGGRPRRLRRHGWGRGAGRDGGRWGRGRAWGNGGAARFRAHAPPVSSCPGPCSYAGRRCVVRLPGPARTPPPRHAYPHGWSVIPARRTGRGRSTHACASLYGLIPGEREPVHAPVCICPEHPPTLR